MAAVGEEDPPGIAGGAANFSFFFSFVFRFGRDFAALDGGLLPQEWSETFGRCVRCGGSSR